MSGNRRRNTQQRTQLERAERERARVAEARRSRRRRALVVLGPTIAVIAVALVLIVVLGGGGRSSEQPVDAVPPSPDSEVLVAEAASDAQADAAEEARRAGRAVAEDFTVPAGTRVDSGLVPLPDDRPVACGATAPANVSASRPRYPGGPVEVLRPGVDYVAVIKTSCGPITIDLLEQDAPVAVNSFVFLTREGFYDGLEVFRDFGGIAAAQAGSGNNAVDWDIGYRLPDELDLAQREGYPVGTVTTVGRGPYTAGSEFFIAYDKEFDRGFQTNRSQTAFGRVLAGMGVLYRMDAMDRVTMGGEQYAERLFMESITIEER